MERDGSKCTDGDSVVCGTIAVPVLPTAQVVRMRWGVIGRWNRPEAAAAYATI